MVNYLSDGYCQLCGCHSDCSELCPECRAELPLLQGVCPLCALPLAQNSTVCGQCQQRPPPWQRLIAAFPYQWPIDQLLGEFKYQRRFYRGRLLTDQLLLQLRHHYQQPRWPDCLIPTPLHWWRHWRRGFNQSYLLAERLGRQLQIPVENCLQRHRYQTPQQNLGRQQRQRNLRGSFSLRHPPTGNTVVLIDDVITTGSTLRAMAEVLQQHGINDIHCWCLARTL